MKDTLISVGLLAAGGVAIAAASGVYGKGSRAKHRTSQDVYRHGRMQALDPNEFPAIPGMQGPFRYAGGDVLYYDPREGKYYDRRRDLYVEHPSTGSRATKEQVNVSQIQELKPAQPMRADLAPGDWTDYRDADGQIRTGRVITATSECVTLGTGVPSVVARVPVIPPLRFAPYYHKGSMTRDGSYEATLMFDADEDDPSVRAQRQLQENPYVPQARPLTAEPQRITSAQEPAGSAARGVTDGYVEDYLNGENIAISTFLSRNLRGKAKSYSGQYARRMTAALEALVASGEVYRDTTPKGAPSYRRASTAGSAARGSSSVLRALTSKP